MPASDFPEYARELNGIVNALVETGQATLVSLQIDQRSPLRGMISGLLRFEDNSELHVREFVDTTLTEPRLMYVYHYQDANAILMFRYDNATHRPKLERAEHKHTKVGVSESLAPTLSQVIDEILKAKSK
jgi:hypothetical protein